MNEFFGEDEFMSDSDEAYTWQPFLENSTQWDIKYSNETC